MSKICLIYKRKRKILKNSLRRWEENLKAVLSGVGVLAQISY